MHFSRYYIILFPFLVSFISGVLFPIIKLKNFKVLYLVRGWLRSHLRFLYSFQGQTITELHSIFCQWKASKVISVFTLSDSNPALHVIQPALVNSLVLVLQLLLPFQHGENSITFMLFWRKFLKFHFDHHWFLKVLIFFENLWMKLKRAARLLQEVSNAWFKAFFSSSNSDNSLSAFRFIPWFLVYYRGFPIAFQRIWKKKKRVEVSKLIRLFHTFLSILSSIFLIALYKLTDTTFLPLYLLQYF